MRITGFIWLEQFVEKIIVKHGVEQDEVEDIFYTQPHIEKASKGRVQGENVYRALGKTEYGRYLTVIVTTNHKGTKTRSFSGFSLCFRVFVVKFQRA